MQSINCEWFHFDFKREKNALFILPHSLSTYRSGADIDARNGTIEIGYLFYLPKKDREKMEKIPILTRNSFFRFICLVWCWHSDLELCVVILFSAVPFLRLRFILAVDFVFGTPIMTVCFYKVEKTVWFCVNVCAIVSKQEYTRIVCLSARTRKMNFYFQPVLNFQPARFF